MAGACHLPLEQVGIEWSQPELRDSRGHDGQKEDRRDTGREKWHFCKLATLKKKPLFSPNDCLLGGKSHKITNHASWPSGNSIHFQK